MRAHLQARLEVRRGIAVSKREFLTGWKVHTLFLFANRYIAISVSEIRCRGAQMYDIRIYCRGRWQVSYSEKLAFAPLGDRDLLRCGCDHSAGHPVSDSVSEI